MIRLLFCMLLGGNGADGPIGFRKVLSHDEKADQMHNKGNQPRDGVGEKQHKNSVIFGNAEDRENPQDTQTASTQQRNNGGGNRITHAAYTANDAIHQTAGEIQTANQLHTDQSSGNYIGALIINVQQRSAKQICKVAQNQSRYRSTGTGDPCNAVDATVFSCTNILAHKGECSL